MPLGPDEKRNENIRLAANWANICAAAIMTGGAVLPQFQLYSEIIDKAKTHLVNVSSGVCVVVALSIHLMGQIALKALR